MGLAQTQDMDKDMDRTVGGVGWGGESRWGWAFLFFYTIPFA